MLSRGNERSDIFLNDKDRTSFLDAVGEMLERFGNDIFAYVVMDWINNCKQNWIVF